MSYLYKIRKNKIDDKHINADSVVAATSDYMTDILKAVSDDDMNAAVTTFYYLANYAQLVHTVKNSFPGNIEEARDYADAHEFYIETLKEGSTIVGAMLSDKFGNLLPEKALQQIATYASEVDNLTKKKIKKHAKSLMPSPRKETRNKTGGKK